MKIFLKHFPLLACAFLFFACSPEEAPTPAPSSADVETLLNKNWDLYSAHLKESPDSAIYFMQKVKRLAKENDNKSWLSSSYWAIAFVQAEQGYMGDAAYHFLKAAQMFKEAGELNRLANAYTGIGDIYAKAQDYETAATYFTQAKDIFLYEGTNADKAKIYRNLAICYKELEDLQEAIEMLSAAERYAMEAQDHLWLSQVYNTWGTVDLEDKNYNKAREHYLLASKFADSSANESTHMKAVAFNNIGEAYLFEENYPLAEKWLKQALEMKKGIGDLSSTQHTLNNLGKLRIKQEQYDAAIEILENGLNNISLGTVDPAVEEGLALMMEALVKTNAKGTPEQYAYLNKQLATYSQKLMSYNNKLSNLKRQLETTSKQQALQLAVEKHTLGNKLEAAEEKNKHIQYAFIIPLLLLIGAGISIYLTIRRNRNAKKLINAIDDVLNKRHQNIAR